MDTKAYEAQMRDVMNLVDMYDIPANSDIYRTFAQRVDNFRPQYQELANAETRAYAMPAKVMSDFNAVNGSEPGQGPDAMTRLSSALTKVGQEYGTRDVLANSINAAKGRIEDLAKSTTEGLALKRQSYLDKYGMLSPLFQTKTQTEEAARERAFRERMEAANRSAARANQQAQIDSYQTFLGQQKPLQNTIEIENLFKAMQKSRDSAQRAGYATQALKLIPQSTYASGAKGMDLATKFNNILKQGGDIRFN